MELQDALQVIQQYKSDGNDVTALFAAAQALPDSNKTPLGLNQWRLTDKPRMEEFNEDNRIIEAELAKKADRGEFAEDTRIIKEELAKKANRADIDQTLAGKENKLKQTIIYAAAISTHGTNNFGASNYAVIVPDYSSLECVFKPQKMQ